MDQHRKLVTFEECAVVAEIQRSHIDMWGMMVEQSECKTGEEPGF